MVNIDYCLDRLFFFVVLILKIFCPVFFSFLFNPFPCNEKANIPHSRVSYARASWWASSVRDAKQSKDKQIRHGPIQELPYTLIRVP
jgi:hypothetical protein